MRLARDPRTNHLAQGDADENRHDKVLVAAYGTLRHADRIERCPLSKVTGKTSAQTEFSRLWSNADFKSFVLSVMKRTSDPRKSWRLLVLTISRQIMCELPGDRSFPSPG
jgi:hypothetical protein